MAQVKSLIVNGDARVTGTLYADVTGNTVDNTKLPLSGGTLTGDLIIGSSTRSSLPNASIKVHDIRDVTLVPSSIRDQGVNFFFHKGGINDEWHSIISIKGWNGSDYNVWQLAGYAGPGTGSTDRDIYTRTGSGSNWSSWATVLTSANRASNLDPHYVKKTGDTLTGALNFKNNTLNKVGDDVFIGDINMAGTLGIKGANGNTGIKLIPRDATTNTDGVRWYLTNNTATESTITGTLTLNKLKVTGTAGSKPLQVRCIVGSNSEGTAVDELHLQYKANMPIKLGNDAAYSISADGGQYTGNAATATKLKTGRIITYNGDIAGSFNFDGSSNVTSTANIYGVHTYNGNSNNYPYHRIAYLPVITGPYQDRTALLYISNEYNGGNFGLIRISLRTNGSNQVSSVEAHWLVRKGFSMDSIQIGLYNVYGATYADCFYVPTSHYQGTTIRALGGTRDNGICRTWQLVNSTEKSNVLAECYEAIQGTTGRTAAAVLHEGKQYSSIVKPVDSGIVDSANKLTTARTINGVAFDGTKNITITAEGGVKTFYWNGDTTNKALFNSIIDYLNTNTYAVLIAGVNNKVYQFNLTSADFEINYIGSVRLFSIPKNISTGDSFAMYTTMDIEQCVIMLQLADDGTVSNILSADAWTSSYNIIEADKGYYGTPYIPTNPGDPATKEYVDSAGGSKLEQAMGEDDAVSMSTGNTNTIYYWY